MMIIFNISMKLNNLFDQHEMEYKKAKQTTSR